MEKKKAIEKLEKQRDLIKELENKSPDSPEFQKWKRDTRVTLTNIFDDNSKHVNEFTIISIGSPRMVSSILGEKKGVTYTNAYFRNLQQYSTLWQSFIDEIKEYWPNEKPTKEQEVEQPIKLGSDIFIVHGRDEGAKQAVARLLEKLNLNPIILHEKPNRGQTIIEKFEAYGNPAFAVILLTPDDVGALATEKDNLKSRARQNVIFELGFFIGKIGRKHVCALCKGNVERPSDYDGILYVPMDDAGGWELKLAKEIKAAGIDVDLNRLLKN